LDGLAGVLPLRVAVRPHVGTEIRTTLSLTEREQ
jgi:hypothetical protein